MYTFVLNFCGQKIKAYPFFLHLCLVVGTLYCQELIYWVGIILGKITLLSQIIVVELIGTIYVCMHI